MARVHQLTNGIARALLCWALVALLLVGARAAGEIQIGEALRDATLQGLNGPPRRLAQYLGRPLIINVWASWCGPCIEEMASLERLVWREEIRPLTGGGAFPPRPRPPPPDFPQPSEATTQPIIDSGPPMSY